jgi:hypothetical protein
MKEIIFFLFFLDNFLEINIYLTFYKILIIKINRKKRKDKKEKKTKISNKFLKFII